LVCSEFKNSTIFAFKNKTFFVDSGLLSNHEQKMQDLNLPSVLG